MLSIFRNVLPTLLLVAIFCLAVMVRLHNLPQWLEEPDRAFYAGEPLMPSVDGYYYLSLSQDLLDGRYTAVNEMRGVPDSPLRPTPPPLLSWLGYAISKSTGLSLNWVGMLLPVLLGACIVFPIYAIGKKLNGSFMGVCSALFAALASGYVLRTGVGIFDTDCLIITLVFSIGYFFWSTASTEQLPGKLSYCLAGLLAVVFFYFWWEQTPDVVIILSGGFFCISLLFFYRPSRIEGLVVYGGISCLLISLTLYLGVDVYKEIYKKVWSIVHYITSDTPSLYPNIGGSIEEQQYVSFKEIAKQTTATPYVFILAVTGLLGVLLKRKKDCLVLSVPFGIGLLGVFFAKRFLIFLSPVLALGLGFFLSEFWQSPRRVYRFLGAICFCLLAVVFYFNATYDMLVWPYNDRSETSSLVQLKKQTPDNGVIWSTWGKGYLINYWGRRATLSDGAIHSGQLSHYLYWPLAQDDLRFAANFMKFFSVRGQKGIADFRSYFKLSEKEALRRIYQILSEEQSTSQVLLDEALGALTTGDKRSAADWISFFFPELERPVYLLLHKRMLFSNWWYWYGTWDTEKQEGVRANYALFPNIMYGGDNIISMMWGGRLDLRVGEFAGGKLLDIYDFNDGTLVRSSFPDGERIMYVDRKLKTAILMEEELWDSVFNRLFICAKKSNEYFTLFYTDGFNVQVWQVR